MKYGTLRDCFNFSRANKNSVSCYHYLASNKEMVEISCSDEHNSLCCMYIIIISCGLFIITISCLYNVQLGAATNFVGNT